MSHQVPAAARGALYFHVTPATNLPGILKDGLRPSRGPRSTSVESSEDEPLIFAFEDLASVEDALMNWLGDAFDDEPLALLALHPDQAPISTAAGYEVAFKCPIPPSKIQVLSCDLDQTPDLVTRLQPGLIL